MIGQSTMSSSLALSAGSFVLWMTRASSSRRKAWSAHGTPWQEEKMDQDLFNAADRHIDEISELLDAALLSPELQKLREAIAALGKRLGERYSVTLSGLVEVFDRQKERN